MSGEILSIQYIKVTDMPLSIRAEKRLPANVWIKKVIKSGSVNVEMTQIEGTPSTDILNCLSSLNVDFSNLKEGDIPKNTVEMK